MLPVNVFIPVKECLRILNGLVVLREQNNHPVIIKTFKKFLYYEESRIRIKIIQRPNRTQRINKIKKNNLLKSCSKILIKVSMPEAEKPKCFAPFSG